MFGWDEVLISFTGKESAKERRLWRLSCLNVLFQTPQGDDKLQMWLLDLVTEVELNGDETKEMKWQIVSWAKTEDTEFA